MTCATSSRHHDPAARGRRRRLALGRLAFGGAALVLATGFAGAVQAEDWPSKPIKIVVNFPPAHFSRLSHKSEPASTTSSIGKTVSSRSIR